MDKPYDATLKTLVEVTPDAWLDLLGLRRAPATVIDADIATVAGAVDKVIRVADDPAYLLHLDFHSGHDGPSIPRRVRLYNACLDYRHDLPVRSVVVVLRPEADSPRLSGLYERQFPGEDAHVVQRYHLLRVWQLPPEPLLAGGLGTLPLAPISAVTEAQLPGVIGRMRERLDRERPQTLVRDLWLATFLLLGLRHSGEFARVLLQGVVSMRESSTYQAILEEGMAEGVAQGKRLGGLEEAKASLLRTGSGFLGEPSAQVRQALEGLDDLETLHGLQERIARVATWEELLDLPTAGRGKRRKRS